MAKVCHYKKSGLKVQKLVSHRLAHCLPHIVSQMVSWVITGANRGIGVSIDISCNLWELRLCSTQLAFVEELVCSDFDSLYVYSTDPNLKSADSRNTVFALTRNKPNSSALLELESKLKNVHVLQADITDVPSLRVCFILSFIVRNSSSHSKHATERRKGGWEGHWRDIRCPH